jgi:hypothetical protein
MFKLQHDVDLPAVQARLDKIKVVDGKSEEGWYRTEPIHISNTLPSAEDQFDKVWNLAYSLTFFGEVAILVK